MRTTMVDAIPWVRTASGDWHCSVANLPLHEPVMARTLCHLRAEVCREDRPPSPRWHADQICPWCIRELVELGEPIPKALAHP